MNYQNCNETFDEIEDYNKYQNKHREETNLTTPCLYPNCGSKCSSYLSFKRYLLRFHMHDHANLSCKYFNCTYAATDVKSLGENYKCQKEEQTGAFICPHCVFTKKRLWIKVIFMYT